MTSSASSTTAREGSSIYYSLLHCTNDQRQHALDTLELIKTVSSSLVDVTEPQVAEKKIHWWHEELARLAKREARHPACVAVQSYLHHKNSVNDILSILSATANERYTPPESESDLNEMISSDYSARVRLLAHALGIGNNDSQNTASIADASTLNALALGFGKTDRLGNLALRLRQGFPVFSSERYKENGLTPDSLFQSDNQASGASDTQSDNQQAATQLLKLAIQDASADFQQALEHRRAGESGDIPLPITILAHLRHAQLRLWQKKRVPLQRESMSLTPMKKFFIAYRCRARAKNSA